MSILRDAFLDFLRQNAERHDIEWEGRHPDWEPRLFVSSLGRCVRAGYLKMYSHVDEEVVAAPFSDLSLEYMDSGVVWEARMLQALREMYGERVSADVHLGDEIWTGRADFILPGKVYEHKDTGLFNFSRGRIPAAAHALQVLMYQRLLLPQNYEAHLYYHGRGKYADFKVWEDSGDVLWEGELNGSPRAGMLEGLSLADEVAKFERWWGKDVLPPVKDDPEDCGNCEFLEHCWGKPF